jgi:hypothetical protein
MTFGWYGRFDRRGGSVLHVTNVPAELDAAGIDGVHQQGKKLGRRKVSPKIENAIKNHLMIGAGTLKVAVLVGCGTVQRVRREMS